MESYANATSASDEGDAAFNQGLSLLTTLRAACEGPNEMEGITIAIVLDVALGRLQSARLAFNALGDFSQMPRG